MTKLSLDGLQSATSLLSQAKQRSADRGELVKLVLAGTSHIDSWLIANRVLPFLQKKGIKILQFSQIASDQASRSASIVPLPDGSAFAHSTSGLWSILEGPEASHEMHHIGLRFASGDSWVDGFQAMLQLPDGPSNPVTPSELAKIWEETTGSWPLGFDVGVLDRIKAFSLDVLDKALNTQGRLGL